MDNVREDEPANELRAAAHELRTPLTAILGFAELLHSVGSHLDESERSAMLGYIIANVKAEVLIIDRYLEGARNGEADVARDRIPLRLRDQVDALIDEIAPVLDGRRVRSFIAKALSVWAEPGALKEILSNLIINAVKYSPSRSTITVAARANAGSVTVIVHNEGAPISANNLGRVFDQGYRVPSDAHLSGAGLGLGIVRDLVTRLGGEISADSCERGTSFTFTLPRAV